MEREKISSKDVFYHIYPLGMTDCPYYNEGEKTAGSRILSIIDHIPHMKELGVTAVYFGPVFESLSHGYDTSDYFRTDSRLGTIEDFKEVFSELKKHDIKIVLDGVFNHVGRGFWAFNDVQHNGKNSKYADWFCGINFDQTSPAGDDFSYEMWEGNVSLVKLNLSNKAVVEHLISAVRMWIDEFDIDGIRLDVAYCLDKGFIRELREFVDSLKNNFWLLGEMIHGDYNELLGEDMLDSVTNYECWKGIYSSHNDKNYFEIAYALKRQFSNSGVYRNSSLYNFADNHDVSRIATLLSDKRDIFNVYTLLFTMPGIPSIYYGSEFGIEGEKTDGIDGDKNVRPKLTADVKSNDVTQHIKKLVELRKNSKALQVGEYEEVLVRNEQFVYLRRYRDEIRFIILNTSDSLQNISFIYDNSNYQFMVKPHSSTIF